MKISGNDKGMTLVEVMMSIMILVPLFAGVMIGYVKCIEYNDLSGNTSAATLAVQNRITEIENTPFSQILATYDDTTFTVPGLDGIGVSYVDDSVDNILNVKTVFSWRERNGRVIGEDVNQNGQWDAGEDTMAVNNELDSIVQLTTIIR